MGEAFGNGFNALALDAAKASAGIALMGITSLGLAIQLSIFDHNVMTWIKGGLIRIVGGALIVGGATGFQSFISQNFR